MRLALVDGTNAVMRRATVQTDLTPERVVAGTVLNIIDFVREVQATHLIVCFDSKESGRRFSLPAYKADRVVDTGPWAAQLLLKCAERGIACVGLKGSEADDAIATLAKRTAGRCEVVILSSDHDLLTLRGDTVRCFQYKRGGGFVDASDTPLPVADADMPKFHALVGGKNGAPGVPGLGKGKAAALLERSRTEGIRWTDLVPEAYRGEAFEWAQMLELCADIPLPPIEPSYCAVTKIKAGVPLGA